MKKFVLITIVAFSLFPFHSFSQDSLRTIDNNAFKPGEFLKYQVYYGWFDVGYARVEIRDQLTTKKGRECYHAIGKSYSVGIFNWLFKIRDHYESHIDVKAIIPWESYRDIYEGGWEYEERFEFNHYQNSLMSYDSLDHVKLFKIADNMQDLLSAFYFARTLDFSNAEIGDKFAIPEFFVEDKVYPLHFTYMGRDTVESPVGKIACQKFKPLLQKGRMFSGKNDMTVWVSADENKIPVYVRSKILVGAIQIDLIEYSNLKHPLNIIQP